MNQRNRYRAIAERDGAFWMVRVPEVDRVTQARRIDQIEAMARSLISIMTGEPEDSFDVEIEASLPQQLADIADHAVTAKARALVAQGEASNALREAARGLTAAGLTVRDVGAILGVTHQRVAQLLTSELQDSTAALFKSVLAVPLVTGDAPERSIDPYETAHYEGYERYEEVPVSEANEEVAAG